MKFKLEIKLGNAEMQTFESVAEALNRTADKLWPIGDAAPLGGESGSIFDVNGNTVGTWEVTK